MSNLSLSSLYAGHTSRYAHDANWLSQPGVKEGLAAQIPIRRIGDPEDVAAVYLFLASDRARHLVGGDINVSGGLLIH